MISAKSTIPGLLKIKVFWNKGYDVTIFVHDVTNKIFSRDSTYIEDVVIWPKFDNSSISMKEVIITSISQEFYQKMQFFRGQFWFKFNSLGQALGMALNFYSSVAKELNLKARKL